MPPPFRASRDRESEFYAEIEGAFRAVIARGYEVSDRRYSSESFGNGWLTLRREHLELRILRDRSQHFVEFQVSGRPDALALYERLRESLGHELIPGLPDLGVESIGTLVANDLAGIEDLMSPARFAETVAECRRRQAQWEFETFGRPLPPDLRD